MIDGRRLIVSYSETRALKDRKRLVDRLHKKVSGETDPRKLVTNRGYLKFLDEKKKGKVVLNETKIAQDSRWDELHGVITNDVFSPRTTFGSLSTTLGYRRINKHALAMRPIWLSQSQMCDLIKTPKRTRESRSFFHDSAKEEKTCRLPLS